MSQPEREIDDRLADWVDGRLADRERERFLAELRVNPQLRQDLADYERTVAAVRQALRAPTRPADLGDRVLGAIAMQKATTAAGRGTMRRRPLYWSLAAAAALLGVAIALNAWPSASMPERSPDTVASIDSLTGSRTSDDTLVREPKQLAEQKAADAPSADTVQQDPIVGENLVTGATIVEGPGSKPGEGDAGQPSIGASTREPAGNAANKEQVPPVPARKNAPAENQPGETSLGAVRELLRQAGTEPASRDRQVQGELELQVAKTAPLEGEAGAAKAGAERAAGAWAGPEASRRGYTTMLPMVSLTRYRAAEPQATAGGGVVSSATPAPLATYALRADAAEIDFDAFFASQVGLPPTLEKKLAGAKDQPRSAEEGLRSGNLRFVPLISLANEAGRDEDSFADRKRAGGEAAAPVGGAALAEGHWFVEGSKKEVADLLRRVAEYGKRAGLELTNGEIASGSASRVFSRGAARPQAPAAEAAPAAPSGQVASSTPPPPGAPAPTAPADAADRMQVVLRFRVLPPK